MKEKQLIWTLYAHTTEHMNNLSRMIKVNPEVYGASVVQVGVAKEDLSVEILPHDYLAMREVRITINVDQETQQLFDDENHKEELAYLMDYIAKNKTISYYVYNSAWEQATRALTNLLDNLTQANAVDEITYLNNTRMEDLEDKFAKTVNRYYKNIINKPVLSKDQIPEYSDEYLEKVWGDIEYSDIKALEIKVNKHAESIADIISKIGEKVNDWGKSSKTNKTYDLWFSFKLEDYRIQIALDKQPHLFEGEYLIEREPANAEDWTGEDRTVVQELIEMTNRIQTSIDKIMQTEVERDVLTRIIKRFYFGKIYHPLNRHLSKVWGFENDNDQSKGIIETEINYILSLVEEVNEQSGYDAKLDVNNWMLHGNAQENGRWLLPEEHQTVVKRVEQYSGSFIDALTPIIQESDSTLIMPYSRVKPIDVKTLGTINTTVPN